jgi:hypothetical protein
MRSGCGGSSIVQLESAERGENLSTGLNTLSSYLRMQFYFKVPQRCLLQNLRSLSNTLSGLWREAVGNPVTDFPGVANTFWKIPQRIGHIQELGSDCA